MCIDLVGDVCVFGAVIFLVRVRDRALEDLTTADRFKVGVFPFNRPPALEPRISGWGI